MTRVMMGLLLLCTTATLVVSYAASEQTSRQLAQYVVVYLVGVVWPGWWAVWLHRELRPSTPRTNALAWSPVVVGCTTILVGMATSIVG